VAVALPLGLAIGVMLGAVGGGGAVLAVPVLVYLLDQDVHAATTTSLAVVAAAALAGGAVQAGQARVCWAQVGVLAPAALLGTVGGTLANEAVSGAALMFAFVPVLLAAAAFTWRRAGADPAGEDACPPLEPGRILAGGLAVGALTGFFGVGGGFLVVPMLALLMHFPLRQAIGTSLVIVGFVSLAGLSAHLWRDATLDGPVTAGMAAGCAAGALAGALIGERLPQRTLAHGFAVLVAGVGVYILVAGAALGGPPGS
jgi:uncharacterized membrane protein YfcA